MVKEVLVEPDGLSVSVLERWGAESPTVVYRLDGQFRFRGLSLSSMFERVHAELFADGTLDHTLSTDETDRLSRLSYEDALY
jgi:hypothetical protein